MNKEATANYILGLGGSLFVLLDNTAEGVILPLSLKDQIKVLEFGYNLPVPIKNLLVDQDGISGVLSFARVPSGVYVPWHAVFAMSDHLNFHVGVCTAAMWPKGADAPAPRPKLRLVK